MNQHISSGWTKTQSLYHFEHIPIDIWETLSERFPDTEDPLLVVIDASVEGHVDKYYCVGWQEAAIAILRSHFVIEVRKATDLEETAWCRAYDYFTEPETVCGENQPAISDEELLDWIAFSSNETPSPDLESEKEVS